MTAARSYRGHSIETVVVGYAYPRNGNLDNPTPRVIYRSPAGIASTLRNAKALIDCAIDETHELAAQ